MVKDCETIVVPQTYIQKAEALEIMSIKNCMISDQTNKPITGIVQDALLGSYLITGDQVIVDVDLWNDAVVSADRADYINSIRERTQELGVNIYSGKSLFSVLFPPDFVFSRIIDNKTLEIKNGVLISGRINKNVLSSGHNSIIQVIHRKYGKDITADFITNLQVLVNLWLQQEGFSVGYSDCLIPDDTKSQISRIVDLTSKAAKIEVEDPLFVMKRETEINQHLNNARDQVAKIVLNSTDIRTLDLPDLVKTVTIYKNNDQILVDHIDVAKIDMNYPTDKLIITRGDGSVQEFDATNITTVSITGSITDENNLNKDITWSYNWDPEKPAFKTMLEAESKGTKLNIAQISGIIGQQNLGGERIPFTMTNNTRVLPHFISDDLDPTARGFCASNYFDGYSPLEFMMHSIGAREGLTDTSVKTSETGYLQRRMGKLMEDLVSQLDGSIRTATGEIIQFQYGNSGLSTDKVVNVSGITTFSDPSQRSNEIISQRKSFTDFAYVYIVNDHNDVINTLVSVYSLRFFNAINNIVIIAPSNLDNPSINALKSLSDRLITFSPPSRWWILNLYEYSKILYIDNSFVFVKNIDHIFQLNTPAATFSRIYYSPYNSDGKPPPFGHLSHGDSISSNLAFDLMSKDTPTFIPGLVLLSPDITLWKSINLDLPFDKQLIDLFYRFNSPWTNIHQIYQLLPWSKFADFNWLTDSPYTIDDAFGFYFITNDTLSQLSPTDNPDVVLWHRFLNALLLHKPSLKPLLTS